MARVIGAKTKLGQLLIEVCPGDDCPTEEQLEKARKTGDVSALGHPAKVTGTSGGGIIGTGEVDKEQRGVDSKKRSEVTHYLEVAPHVIAPFRLVDGAYDLNHERAADVALKAVEDSIAERFGEGDEATSSIVGRTLKP